MKQLIKSATVYSAELPAAEHLEQHLQENAFTEMTDLQIRAVGFVAFDSGLYTAQFPGGVAFKVRIDEKIIPASQVEVDFAGVDMKMGYNRPLLAAAKEAGTFVGQGNLPVCITGTMIWQATVLVGSGGKNIAVPFRFESAAPEGH